MLLLSLQLSSGTFATSVVYSLPCEIDRIPVDNWFSNFIIVLIFSLTGLSMNLNDVPISWDKLVVRSMQKMQELTFIFHQPRSSASISCSNYLVICALYTTNKFVL